jgi:hypothetical protein
MCWMRMRCFKQWRADPTEPPLFTKGGTHWNHYGASRVIAILMQQLAAQTGQPLPSVKVMGHSPSDRIIRPDNDLGELANLWQSKSLAGPQVLPEVEIDEGGIKPDILFICDSFGAMLVDMMQAGRLFRQQDTYFYNRRHMSWPRRRSSGDGEPDAPGVLDRLAGRDAVVIVQVEVFSAEDRIWFCNECPGGVRSHGYRGAGGPPTMNSFSSDSRSGSTGIKRILLLAAIVFSLCLALPLVQMTIGWPPDIPLAGAESPVPPPTLAMGAWWNGTMQAEFDTWLAQRIGLRGVLVRTANQIQFSLFRELAKRGGTQVFAGPGWIPFREGLRGRLQRGREAARERAAACERLDAQTAGLPGRGRRGVPAGDCAEQGGNLSGIPAGQRGCGRPSCAPQQLR